MGVPHMGEITAKDSASSASDAAVLDLETENRNKNERFTGGGWLEMVQMGKV